MSVTHRLRWTSTFVALGLGSAIQMGLGDATPIASPAAVVPVAPLAPGAAQTGKPAGPGPYAIAQRPMPTGRDLETLLPRKVGAFVRAAFPPGTKPSDSEDLNTDYKAGTDTVNVGFSIPGNPKDAHEAIRIGRGEAITDLKRLGKASVLRRAQESIGTPTSYYKVDDFIVWSRGGYFFYAKANSAAALDAFMKAFPF